MTLLDRGDDLRVGPAAEAGLLVRRQVGADEGAEARQLEADVGAAEVARHVRIAEEVARRVAVVATRDGDEILAARDRRGIGGIGDQGHAESGQRRGDGFDEH